MRGRAWLFPVLSAVVVGVSIVLARPPGASDTRSAQARSEPDGAASSAGAGRLRALEHYVDPDFGFSLGVPSGWEAVIAAETDEQLAMLEPGYAVGFESPPQHDDDRYADYLMIELLPGRESDHFATDGGDRRATVIDGRAAWRERLELSAEPVDGVTVELVAYQAELVGLGYTVGFYAVGEVSRESMLADAFEAMLRTFRLPHPPFAVC